MPTSSQGLNLRAAKICVRCPCVEWRETKCAPKQMQFFFCDIYDVPDISFIHERLASMISIDHGTFDESALASDQLVTNNLIYHFVWRGVMGVQPTKIQAYDYSLSGTSYELEGLLDHLKATTFMKLGFISMNIELFRGEFDKYVNMLGVSDFIMSELRRKLKDRFNCECDQIPHGRSLFDFYKGLNRSEHLVFDSPTRVTNPVTNNVIVANTPKHYFPNICRLEAIRYVLLNDYQFIKRCISNHCVYADADADVQILASFKKSAGENAVILTNLDIAFQLPRVFPSFSWFSQTLCSFHKSIRNRNIRISNDATAIQGVVNVQIVGERDLPIKPNSNLLIFASSTDIGVVSTPIFHIAFFDRLLACDIVSLFVDKMLMTRPLAPRLTLADNVICPHCVLLVDNRANIWSILACRITLMNLIPNTWDLVICTPPCNQEFYRNHLGDCKFISNHRMDAHNFNPSMYSDLMKDSDIWAQLKPYDKCLVIQDDGMIIRPGIERSGVFKYDYTGAPWSDVAANQHLKRYNNDLVGNGGCSLRTVEVMHRCCCVCEDLAHELWLNDTEIMPEDVFFSKAVGMVGGTCATFAAARNFSSEQVLNPMSYGIHKIWPYHSPDDIMKFLQSFY